MKLYIDSADTEAIKRLVESYPIDGVTTNPTILASTRMGAYPLLKEIREIITDERDLFVQTVSRDCEKILREAEKIQRELGDNTYIKIPAEKEGYKAMYALKKQGVRVCATAVYDLYQALLAAKCGVDYIAPYVGRIDDTAPYGVYNRGINRVKFMKDILEHNGFETKILAASLRCELKVTQLAEYGIESMTLSVEVFESLLTENDANKAIDGFVNDFEGLFGKGKTMDTVD